MWNCEVVKLISKCRSKIQIVMPISNHAVLQTIFFLSGWFGALWLLLRGNVDGPQPDHHLIGEARNLSKDINYTFAGAKKVLFYSTFYGQGQRWRMGEGRVPFIKAKCPVDNCYFTSDRSLMSNLADYDALVFMMRSKNLLDQQNKLVK